MKINAKSVIGKSILLILTFSLMLMIIPIYGQTERDEFSYLKNYILPSNAVSIENLDEKEIMEYNAEPFTGIAYESYKTGKLFRIVTYRKGIQHGPIMIWYPDGNPQMSANYKNGAPHGRFMGWYNNGKQIYNIFLNQGKLGADNLLDDDTDRLGSDEDVIEKEATEND